MKDASDIVTADCFEDVCMVAKKVVAKKAVPAKKGRPRVYASDAEKQAAYRERNDLVQMNVSLPRDVVEALDAYMARHVRDGAGMSKGAVIAKLLRTQLLRKR